MNILVSVNSKFLYALKILLFSLYKTQKDHLEVYLLNNSLNQEELMEVQDFCNKMGLGLNIIDVPEEVNQFFSNHQTLNNELRDYELSIETYFRLFAVDLLPESLDRILWLDADCLVKGDLSGLYYDDFQDTCLIASDSTEWRGNSDCLDPIRGVNPDFPVYCRGYKYFNAGVILFNLTKIRESGLLERSKVFEYIENANKNKVEFFDQGILNILFRYKVKWVNPVDYNCGSNQEFLGGMHNEPVKYEAFKNSKIIHYASKDKPWNLDNKLENEVLKYWKKFESEYRRFIK